jgi:hypothetical protein
VPLEMSCTSRRVSPTFTDANCTQMDMVYFLWHWNFHPDWYRMEKLNLKSSQKKSLFPSTKILEKKRPSLFAWPVKYTMRNLQHVLRRVSSTAAGYLRRKQAENKTPRKESKAHQATNTSTWSSTVLGIKIDKYACEGCKTALRMRGISPLLCM